MLCESVRPHDIKIKGVESAYAFPYFHLDGTVNEFQRWKLFPPIKTDHGTMRYWQPKDSLPHLYIPPIMDWQAVAKDVAICVVITEGEKKTAAACQHGLITAGIAGNWCHAATLDNGDKLTLPMLDEFIWPNRTVLICPDSDAWHDGKKAWDILAGFFALAKKLQQRGADVQFVVLPDLHGIKAGLDDWLLVPGNDIAHGWPKLERILLDDDRFASHTAWWQKREEKQATYDAIKQQDAEVLEITEAAGLYSVRSLKHSVTMIFDRLTEAHGGVGAELTITLGGTELIAGDDLRLKSDTAKTKLASGLTKLASAIPWKVLLQKACSLVLKRHRQGDPPTHLTKDSPVEHLSYAVNPLVFKKKITIVYGDGGLGKSTWALFCAMVVSTGGSVAGISAGKGSALYLDWEDDADVHTRRLQAIQAGHPDLTAATILYQRCVEPLTKVVHPLVRRIVDERITFVVLDSLMASTGGDSSAEGTAKLFAALRLLNCEVLALGHVPKTQPEGQDRTTVYGSVFNQNFARSVWELKKEQEVGDDTAILGLFQRKSNLSRLHQPIGLKVTQNETNTLVVYEPYDLSQAAELAQALPLANQIRNLLEDGEPRRSKTIAEELGAKWSSVKATLSKHGGRKWMKIGDKKDPLWTVLAG